MLTDEQLVARAQAGDTVATDALLERFEGVACWIAREFFDPSADRDDLRQEARLGVFKAVRDYRAELATSFATFARLCCRRQVITAIVASNRAKHAMLTHAVRVRRGDNDEPVDAVDLVEAVGGDPAAILAERAQLQTVVRAIRDGLSPLEYASLVGLVFNGDSYEEIVAGLHDADERNRRFHARSVKGVDNALVRARLKLRFALAEADAVPLDLGRAA